mgnify:CR=1 FL=1
MKRSLADLSDDDRAMAAHVLGQLASLGGLTLAKMGAGRKPRTVEEWERAERLVEGLPDLGVGL